ncbi:hypothetical protein [Marinigracilibium pacificum]|uniref:tRNA (Guanine-N1)-methyltransferase n=1 Tax=Marinigracilibium pacificum TaxID=2729599 RepID=A0A848J6B9_9BACT|nr:hypothetical protein [Marinigracilibium pacificum]NMM50014.1 hypothetical protein [Marinigracilibium pacificum]
MTSFKFRIAILLIAFCTSFSAVSQESEEDDELLKGDLKGQYEELLDLSKTYNTVKTVRLDRLAYFKQSLNDSLAAFNARKDSLQSVIKNQTTEIEALNGNVSTLTSSNEDLQTRVDNLMFLGMPVSKTGYVTFSLILFAVLGLLGGFFFWQYKRSNSLTKEAKKNLKTKEDELQDFRQRTQEKEIKIMRELQDQRNTVDELRKKLSMK